MQISRSKDEERLESNRNRRDGACARTCTNASHHIPASQTRSPDWSLMLLLL